MQTTTKNNNPKQVHFLLLLSWFFNNNNLWCEVVLGHLYIETKEDMDFVQ